MPEVIQDNEPIIRMTVFLAVFAAMAAWEYFHPRRPRAFSRPFRWSNNLALVVLNTLILRLLFPIAAVGMAAMAAVNGWGLLNVLVLPDWLAVVLAFLALDLAIYWQHRLFHWAPWLWRLHRMHHADLDFDVSTALRFHPLEILLSMAIKIAVVLALGAPALAVLLFEVVLNAAAMFNHANVELPGSLDRYLRLALVTPDMHRVHHSIDAGEHNSNFGFNLPWWDRLFRSYTPQPRGGHQGMTIGIGQFREGHDLRLDRMLTQPFRDDSGKLA